MSRLTFNGINKGQVPFSHVARGNVPSDSTPYQATFHQGALSIDQNGRSRVMLNSSPLAVPDPLPIVPTDDVVDYCKVQMQGRVFFASQEMHPGSFDKRVVVFFSLESDLILFKLRFGEFLSDTRRLKEITLFNPWTNRLQRDRRI